MPLQVSIHEADIIHHIRPHLLQPFRPIGISGFRSNVGKKRPVVELSCFHEGIEGVADLFVGNDGVGGDDTRNVERLTGRHECNAAMGRCFGNGCKRVMHKLRIVHLRMDFIGDNQQVMFRTDFGQLLQRLFFPDDATRIVRIAYNQYFAPVVDDRLQMLERRRPA